MDLYGDNDSAQSGYVGVSIARSIVSSELTIGMMNQHGSAVRDTCVCELEGKRISIYIN